MASDARRRRNPHTAPPLFPAHAHMQYSGRMQCAGRPGDTCTDSVCPLPTSGGIGVALDCDDTNPPTGFP